MPEPETSNGKIITTLGPKGWRGRCSSENLGIELSWEELCSPFEGHWRLESTVQGGIRGIKILISPFFLPLNSLLCFLVVHLKWKPEDRKPVAMAHSGKTASGQRAGWEGGKSFWKGWWELIITALKFESWMFLWGLWIPTTCRFFYLCFSPWFFAEFLPAVK